MRIGEVARKAGLESSAIRYYEKVGILPGPTREAGRRRYGPEILDLLLLVRFARGVGLSIREVRVLFGDGRPGRISDRWRKLAKEKMQSLKQEMTRIDAARELLAGVLKCGCVDPVECGRTIRAKTELRQRAGETRRRHRGRRY